MINQYIRVREQSASLSLLQVLDLLDVTTPLAVQAGKRWNAAAYDAKRSSSAATVYWALLTLFTSYVLYTCSGLKSRYQYSATSCVSGSNP